ncbi:hypothetical protein Nmel_012306 [Mimus melanotis]
MYMMITSYSSSIQMSKRRKRKAFLAKTLLTRSLE